MNKQIQLPQLHEIKAERCKRSLFYFLKEFWGLINTAEYGHNWHIEFLCDKIQLTIDKFVLNRQPHIPNDKWYTGIVDGTRKNLIYVIPPGTTKSTILSRVAPAWVAAIDPGKTWIRNTIDDKNATEFSRKTMDIINSDKYKLYFPNTQIRKDSSAVNLYTFTGGGMQYSLTTRGSNTGKHADIISDDDPMDYKTAQRPAEAKECIEGFKSLQTRKKDKLKTVYILGMQRLSSFDTVAHALKTLSDVDYVCLPAEDIHDNIEPAELRKHYVDGLLDPLRLSRKALSDVKKGLSDDSKPISEMAYDIQFNQLNTALEGFLYPAFNFVPSLPENRDSIIRISVTDVADTGADYFSTWFAEINNNKVYIFDAIYTQQSSSITNTKLKTGIEKHGCIINLMETNNQGSVYVTLLHTQGVPIKGYTSTGSKDHRIKSYSQFVTDIYFVDPSNHSNPEYIAAVKHLQSYPKEGKSSDGHDDAEDSLTELIRYIYTNYRFLLTQNL